MNSLRPVLGVLSFVWGIFALMFLVPLAWDFGADSGALRDIWLGGLGVTGASAMLLGLLAAGRGRELRVRDGFLLVNLVWVTLPAFAALPLVWAIPGLSWTDAYFEAMSGLTATGATALSGLDQLPLSVNVWRCFLQLVGGLGIVLLVVAVLPLLGLGSVQLFKAETPGPMKDSRLTPRVAETARGLWGVYFFLSGLCWIAYYAAGMNNADAFMHMCTTMGLGGFSSKDASLGHWDSAAIEWVAIAFMAAAGVNFARYFIVWHNRSFSPLLRDVEVRMYLLVLIGSAAFLSIFLLVHGQYTDAATAFREAAFHVVSVATTTGYATTDYSLWPTFAAVWLMFLGAFASCAGSTGGGIKMVRMVILIKQARRELVRALHPRVVNPIMLGRTMIDPSVVAKVMAFMLIYGASTLGLTMLLLLSDLDIVTAFSAVIATVNNIGPGLGQVGPASNFGVLTDFQTWVCTFAMLLGRLEFLAVMVIFIPQFWRK